MVAMRGQGAESVACGSKHRCAGERRKIAPRLRAFSASALATGVSALALTLGIGTAQAQDATWLATPGSGNYNTGANWSPATAPGSGDTAFFGTSSTTTIGFSQNTTTVGGWTFNAGASNYTINSYNVNSVSLSVYQLVFDGAGIVVNGGSVTINHGDPLPGRSAVLRFTNSSTAGAATINNSADVEFHDGSSGGTATIVNDYSLLFLDNSSAGSSHLTNNDNAVFGDQSTAGSSTIVNNDSLQFHGSSTAGTADIQNNSTLLFIHTASADSAAITNANDARLGFWHDSTAGNATITNAGSVEFRENATGGGASVTNNGFLDFFADSTAGSATIVNEGSANLWDNSSAGTATITSNDRFDFNNTSTAGGATITNNDLMRFRDSSTGGNATFVNNDRIHFSNSSTAGNATITNNDDVSFGASSTAGNATIINNAVLSFLGNGTAGSATITNNGGRLVEFSGSSTAGNSSITNDGGVVRFVDSTSAGAATITNASSFPGSVFFLGNSTGGNAALVNDALGVFDFSATTGPAGDGQVSAGSIAGAGSFILGATTLTTGGNNQSTTVSGVISGTGGSLIKAGTGTLILSGVNTYTGDTTVNGGRLLVNGSLSGGGDTFVASGATLGGTGSLSGALSVNAGGTLAPGNSVGALTAANASFAMGSIFEVELNGGGNVAGINNDHLNVTGTATLNGGTIHVTPENGTDDGTTYTPGTTYTVLTFATAGTPGGQFDAVTDDYAFLDFTDSYDANNVYLTSSLVGGGAGTCPSGLSSNQNGACGGVLSIGSGGLHTAVINLSNAEAPGALDRLSGEIHASVQSTLVEDSRFAREAALDRLRLALGAVAAGKTGTTEKRVNDGFAFWGRGFGSWGDWDGNGNAGGFERSTGGFFLGGDARLGDDLRLGAFGGYAKTKFKANSRHSDGSAESWHLGVYGGARLGGLGLRFGGAWSWHDVKVGRSVAFTGFADSLSSSYDARTLQVFGEAGYRIDAGATAFEPFVGLAHVDLRVDGYDERGGQASLSADSQSMATTFATIGLHAETRFDLGGTTARLNGMAGWRHAFGDVKPKAAHAFAGGGEFDVAGVPIAKDALVLDLGAAVELVENVTLSASYKGQFGSDFADHGLEANLVVRF